MAAITTWGRIFTMIYAMMGIPLVITILNDWGTMMFYVVNELWKKKFILGNHCVKSLFRSKNHMESQERICYPSTQTCDDNPIDNSDTIEPIPLFMVAFVLGFWTVLCSAMFVFFEKWTFFESLYFFFISLTTIGLGDLTLSHNVAVVNFLPILIGLSVCSMAINVTQMQLEILFGKIVKLIDTDFKTNLSESDDEKRKLNDTAKDGDMQPRLSKMRQRKEKDVINQYCTIMTSSDRFLMRFLSDHQIKMLNEKFDSRAKLQNNGTQTKIHIKESCVQTGVHGEWLEVVEDEQPQSPTPLVGTKRLYIYNTGE